MIKGDNIVKSYGELQVLKGVSLEIDQGEIITILGKSGAGKSTLLHILGTLDNADAGRIVIDGVEVSTMNQKKLAAFRNQKIGFVFQFHHLLNEFTALENVCIPAMILGKTKKESAQRAMELLDFLGLKERYDHKPGELSGGEQQRVAFARAMINRPGVIFADEPTGNLDSDTSSDLHKLIISLRDEFNQTYVIVTHNDELAKLSDRSLMMENGHILNG